MAEKAELLRKTKSMLRSVLLSAPRGVVAKRIQSEYRSLTGKLIPYQELGFSSLQAFLDSIPDVISSGLGATGEMTYFGRADSSTEHIAKLVAKQKKGKVRRAAPQPLPPMYPQTRRKFFSYQPSSRQPRHYAPPPVPYYKQKKAPLIDRMPPVPGKTVRNELYSVLGKGKIPVQVDINAAHQMGFKSLVSNLAISKNELVEVRGFVHGSPQRKIRRVSSGKIQEFISVLLRESLPSGPTLLCLFVEPTWDVRKNDDVIRLLQDQMCLIVYGLPEVINTPKFHSAKSIAIKSACFEIVRGRSQYLQSQPQSSKGSSIQPPSSKNSPSQMPGKHKPSALGKEVLVSEIKSAPSVSPTLTESQMSDVWKLEAELYGLIKASPNGVWWARVRKMYSETYHKSLATEDLDLVLNMSRIKVENLRVLPENPTLYPVEEKVANPSLVEEKVASPKPVLLPKQVSPKEGEEMPVVLTHVVSPRCFYGYLSSSSSSVDKLCKDMSEYYGGPSDDKTPSELVPGTFYSCRFSQDGRWYRAKLLSAEKDNLHVMYADFGNDEWVSTDCLRVLNEKFCQNPPFAVLMSLCEGTEDQEVLTQLETLLENPVNVLFVKKKSGEDDSGFCVEVNDAALQERLLVLRGPPTPTEPPPLPEEIELPKNTMFSCGITHILTPGSFYIQRIGPEFGDALLVMEDKMGKDFSRSQPADLPEVLVDSLVVHVNKEEDGSLYWYRAKVLSLLPEEKVEVKLVDYGNTDVVARSSLKVLPHKYYQLPQQAVHCCLRGLSEILESPEIFEKFLAYQDEESLTAKVMDSPGTRITLELFDVNDLEKGSINMQLMALGVHISKMAPSLPKVGERVCVNLTDVSSEGVISVQLHGPTMKYLEDLMEQINSKYNEKPTAADYIQDAQEGMECCAKYNDQWYRVRLISVSPDKVAVEYIDSGRRADLERRNLRKALNTSLFSLPPQAVRCVLTGLPPTGGEWKEEAVSTVYEIITAAPSEIEVVSVSGECPVVRMMYKVGEDEEEQDLSTTLSSLPELFGLPPVEKDHSSPEQDNGSVSTDNFEEFTFETDTGGEEEEEEGGKPVQQEEENPEQLQKWEEILSGKVESVFEVLSDPYLKKIGFKLVNVLQANSPNDFWVGPCSSDVEMFQQVLHYHCSRADPSPPLSDVVFAVEVQSKVWARAHSLKENTAFVQLIDTGSTLNLREDTKCVALPPVLSAVPGLALRCCLCGVKPVSGTQWSIEAASMFTQFVIGRTMWAFCSGKCKRDNAPVNLVDLVDTTTGEDIVLSDKLVSLGFARPVF
jgi:tudor domain-containing protein 1/4/6/7